MSFALWSLTPLFISLGVIISVGIIVALCLYSEFESRDAAYVAYWEEKRGGASCL